MYYRIKKGPATPQSVVGAWLRKVPTEETQEVLARWLEGAPDTSKPLPALVLVGKKGTGKSLLTQGLEELWGTSGDAQRFFGGSSWNETMYSSPLLTSEGISLSGRRDYDLFKIAMREPAQVVQRKNMRPVAVVGYLRVVIMCENLEAIRTPEGISPLTLTPYLDIVHLREDSVRTLENLDISKWVFSEKGHLPTHIRWLSNQ